MAHRQQSSHHTFPQFPLRVQTTPLELVWTVSQVTSDDQPVVAPSIGRLAARWLCVKSPAMTN